METIVAFGGAIVIFYFAYILIKAGWQEIGIRRKIQKYGVDTTATIDTAKRTPLHYRGAEFHHIFYSFEIQKADGSVEQVAGAQRLDRPMFNKVKNASTVSVRYLPDEPSVSRVNQPQIYELINSYGFIVGGIFLGLLGLVVCALPFVA